MKILSYRIAVGYNPDSLTEEVNQAIKEGWEPHGSMSFFPKQDLGRAWFFQPLVLSAPVFEEDEKNI